MSSTVAAATTTSSVSTDGITTLAMTTIFTPPASCSSSWTFEPSGANLIPKGLLLQNAAASDNADPNCFPSGYTHFGREMASIAFSPGYCPEGYTTANMVIHNPVTTAQCCPSTSNFDYLTISMGEDSTYAGCTSMFPSTSSTIVTVRQVSDESTQVSGPITMWAQPLQIQLEATDSSLFTTATSTSASAASSNTATASSTSTSDTSSTASSSSGSGFSSSSNSSSGLSKGASIGIGVGVGVGGALILAALAFWFLRRRKTQKEVPSNTHPSYQRSAHAEASELGGSSQQTAPVSGITPSTNPSELAADQAPRPVHELSG
ncbi:uncharacterized protein N7511_010970 [Penicillium nucicola]|uniref:uncharacterized protein n=1 Tax=Penicillium nucicola TaxID=1850975 RepID=UPI0025452B8B|nr:uncharacterized protein N7511_010970 [Penicillium nucicola]KAJ5749274.1 hypothetical protein N7511_010970 [Penicillium nucicola]